MPEISERSFEEAMEVGLTWNAPAAHAPVAPPLLKPSGAFGELRPRGGRKLPQNNVPIMGTLFIDIFQGPGIFI